MEDNQNNATIYASAMNLNDSSSLCNEFDVPSVDKLKVGMIFNSVEEGIQFYKTYAHRTGFSVRLWSENRRNGVLCWKYCVCSKEGWHEARLPNQNSELKLPIDMNSKESSKGKQKLEANKVTSVRKRTLTREGCMARCAFRRTIEGKYEIANFQDSHSHVLLTPSKRHMLQSAREVNPMIKSMLHTCHRNNIGTSKAFNLVKDQVGGLGNVGCIKRNLQNYYRDLKALLDDSDAHILIDKFEKMKVKNPSFYFAYEMDEKRNLKHVFWADGRSRKNYYFFGDAISFDTTYSTNKYSMIFAPFTGINHHRQSITFGAGFLANEKTESFVWLFEKFLEAMGGQKPIYIVTDQDPAMKIAVERIFNTSIHRFCVWHIMKKVSEKVGGVLNREPQFNEKLNLCVWGSETPQEFESSWISIMTEFDLEENDWFALMYSLRDMWIPAYFYDILLSGLMRTTSRSESENAVFSNLVNKELSLTEVWMRFDCAIEIQRENENECDIKNISSVPQLKAHLDIEKHASDVYTHKNFYIFQEELWSSCIECVVINIHEDDAFKIFTVRDNGKRSYKLTREVIYYPSTSEVKCSCKMFELEGIACRHSLATLRVSCLKEIPQSLILKRWTKVATREPIFDDHGTLLEGCEKEKNKSHFVTYAWGAFSEVMEYAEQNEADLKMVMEVCIDLKKKLMIRGEKVVDKAKDFESFIGCSIPNEVEIHPPNSSKTKGSGKRLKGGKEMAIEQQQKRQRRCNACGLYTTHDSRNCPTKE